MGVKIISKKIKCNGIEYWKIKHPKYKYMLSKDYKIQTEIYGMNFTTKYFRLFMNGKLVIKKGYCWDGASGPTWDDSTNMRGSLVHDVLYQMIRMHYLHKKWRSYADDIFYDLIRENGMCLVRAKYYWLAVRSVGWIYT
jgi:hypothetical protein